MSVHGSECPTRVAEGRRNRCTRQRDADRRTILFFFSRSAPPRSLLLLLSLFLPSFSSPALSSLLLEPSAITVQSPGFYRRNVATGSRSFRSEMIEKSSRTERSYLRCRCLMSRALPPSLQFLFFRVFSCHRLINNNFIIYVLQLPIDS